MSSFERDGIIRMRLEHVDAPIELNSRDAVPYFGTSHYDKNLAAISYSWHMIIVHHKGRYKKPQILNAFFKAIGDNECFPVAYREYKDRDKFFVRKCRSAIQKLFDTKLLLRLPRGGNLPITVQLNVSTYQVGQVHPGKKIEKIVEKQFNKLERFEGIPNVLNLDNLGNHLELQDIIINLGNLPAFEMVCKTIVQTMRKFQPINGLILSSNNISTLQPMRSFVNCKFQLLDLRFNNINQVNQLKELRYLTINQFYVSGNPLSERPEYLEQIKERLPDLTLLDGIQVTKISNSQVRVGDTITLTYPGELVEEGHSVQAFQKFKTSEMWHQILIRHNGFSTKTEVLDAIYKALPDKSGDFFPCYYKIDREEDSFFVRGCFDNLASLLSNSMTIKLPDSDEKIELSFKMNVSNFKKGHVEPLDVIAAAVDKRFNLTDRLLDLDNFITEEDLKNVSLLLSHPRCLTRTLRHGGNRFLTNIVELRLSRNEIVSGKGMNPISWMTELRVLDLSNNLVESISDLEGIPSTTIREIRLDGNPLCSKYLLGHEYIRDVKRVFPELTKLDGIVIADHGLISVQKNYLCSIEAYEFVEKFITNYFSTYDSPQREQLSDMYDEDAIFTLSFMSESPKTNPRVMMQDARFKKYNSISRNLIRVYSLGQSYQNLYLGSEQINSVLKNLPPTEHDFFSFTTDVPIFTPQIVLITVTGVFHDSAVDVIDNDILLSFSRTFILQSVGVELGIFNSSTEWKIINDKYYITTPTQMQFRNAFKFAKSKPTATDESLTSEEKESYTIMFQDLTGLRPVWCNRCLEDAKWDFPKAVEIFMKMVQENRIPGSGYLPDQRIA